MSTRVQMYTAVYLPKRRSIPQRFDALAQEGKIELRGIVAELDLSGGIAMEDALALVNAWNAQDTIGGCNKWKYFV